MGAPILAETRPTLIVGQQLEFLYVGEITQPSGLTLVFHQILLRNERHPHSVDFIFNTIPPDLLETHLPYRSQHVYGIFPSPESQVFFVVQQIHCGFSLRDGTHSLQSGKHQTRVCFGGSKEDVHVARRTQVSMRVYSDAAYYDELSACGE